MVTEMRQAPAKANPARMETRHRVAPAEAAFVEFDYPQPKGRRRCLAVHDMSSSGICFKLPFHGLAGIDPSTHILDVIIRIGGCEIGGELLVTHTTRESEEKMRCGGRFYPATESDHLQMVEAIAGLEGQQET